MRLLVSDAVFSITANKMLDEIDYWHKNNYIPIEVKCGESEFVSAFRRVFYPKNKYLQLAEML